MKLNYKKTEVLIMSMLLLFVSCISGLAEDTEEQYTENIVEEVPEYYESDENDIDVILESPEIIQEEETIEAETKEQPEIIEDTDQTDTEVQTAESEDAEDDPDDNDIETEETADEQETILPEIGQEDIQVQEETEQEEIVEENVSDMIVQEGAVLDTSLFETGMGEDTIDFFNAVQPNSLAEGTGFDIVEDFEALNELFVNAAEHWESVIDVQAFEIPKDNNKVVFSKLVNKNPQLFYIASAYRYSYSKTTGFVTKYYILYSEEYNQSHVDAFNTKAESILGTVDMNWSQEQKALYLHDVLVTRVEYDDSYSRYNAYNALVEGSAVCQGYSLAYEYLLSMSGISADVISSKQLDHAWNTVEIDGSVYYADCTWDDPLYYYLKYCKHTNFLRSKSGLINTGHYSDDWTNTDGESVYETTAPSDYGHAYWRSSITAIPHIGDFWAYTNTNGIYMHDYRDGTDVFLTGKLTDVWDVIGSDNYYTDRFIDLDSYADKFIASQQDTVYLIDLNGNVMPLGNIPDTEREYGRIYGIQREDLRVRYDLYEKASGSDKITSGYFSIPETADVSLYFSVNEIGITESAVMDLNAFLTTDAEYVYWKSSDNTVISVDQQGMITAVGKGSAVITASVGNLTASVLVHVEVPLEHFELNKNTLFLTKGTSETLIPIYTPEDTTERDIQWSSSDETIAYVNDGTVTAVNIGKVTITAKIGDLEPAECELMVQFSDVTDPELFYYGYVYDMVERGVVGGYIDGTFRPTADCNRAAVVTFLWRLSGKPEPSKIAEFKDMTGNTDFDKAISWAAENNITTGWADNTFRPWNTCNRAAVMTFLWRAAGKPEPTKMAEFTDMTGNKDFDTAISWASEKGITTGWADGTFRPWNTCNRLAVVSFLARYDALKSN